MLARVWALIWAALAVGLIVAGLWGWTAAEKLAGSSFRPDLAQWSIRCASAGSIAAAQAMGVKLVAGKIYGRWRGGEAVALSAAMVSAAALAGALTLGLMCG